MVDAVKMTPEDFKKRCGSLGGKVYKVDDRYVCDVPTDNDTIRFVLYPDGVVSVDKLPDPIEKLMNRFYLV